jgi:hypothetical protein
MSGCCVSQAPYEPHFYIPHVQLKDKAVSYALIAFYALGAIYVLGVLVSELL